jgi:hypothetical protein
VQPVSFIFTHFLRAFLTILRYADGQCVIAASTAKEN